MGRKIAALSKKMRLGILAIKDALELMRLAREEFGEKINKIGKELELKVEKE